MPARNPHRRSPRRLLATVGVVVCAALSLGASPSAPLASDPGGMTPPRAEAALLALENFLSPPHAVPGRETGPPRFGPGHGRHCHFQLG